MKKETERRYLPVWTDECMGYDRQYVACNVIVRYKEVNKESLLPVRFKYDLTLFYNKGRQWRGFWPRNVYEVKNTLGPKHIVESCGTKLAFAECVYHKAAELLCEKYPDIEEFEFGEQKENGIYPIVWKYPTACLKEELFDIIKNLIKDGFSIKEFIECTEIKKDLIKFTGIFDCDDECEKLFENNRYDAIPDKFRGREYRYTFEECLPYYVEIDDSLLELGNQQRIYNMTYEHNKPLFEAAKAGDIDRLCALAEEGYNLNAIDNWGRTPFLEYVDIFLSKSSEFYGIFSDGLKADMERMIALGANPAVFGITNDFEYLLQVACEVSNAGLVKYLLEKGVNPNMYMFTDSYEDKDITLFDWVEGHSSKHDEYADSFSDKVYEIMKEAIKQMKGVADL